MDAYEIALMMANQDPARPLKMKYGTVSRVEVDSLDVVPDGFSKAVPAVKCCHPLIGNRVVLLINKEEWIALSIIEQNIYSPFDVDDLWATFSHINPHEKWPGTVWVRISGKFLLGAVDENDIDKTGGESSHRLTVDELPYLTYVSSWDAVSSGIKYANNDGSNYGIATQGANMDKSHNNMPPYITINLWRRIA